MNTRSVEILKKLCGGKNYQVEDLAHDFEISIRMIRYVIDDINDFLETINIKKNIMIRNGKIQFNITHQEKEILMILVPAEKKLPVMEAINSTLSSKTGERGIVFSLPVHEVFGLKQ